MHQAAPAMEWVKPMLMEKPSIQATLTRPPALALSSRDIASFGLGGQWPPLNLYIYIYIYMYVCILILAILFYKITFFFP